MKKNAFVALTVSFCLFCSFGCGRKAAEEKEDYLKIADSYFKAVQTDNIEKALGLYSEQFFAATPRASWEKTLRSLRGKLGKLVDYAVAGHFRQNAGAEAEAKGEYFFLFFDTRYSEHRAKEEFILFRADGKEDIKIISHRISSLGMANE